MKSKIIFTPLIVALVCGGFFSFLASERPDGLEKVAEESGFIDAAQENTLGIISDYLFPIGNEFFSVSLAGILGVLLTFGLTYVMYKCFI